MGQPAVGAEQADGLVLKWCHQFVAVFIGVDVGALDHAAGHAGMGGFAAAFQVLFADVIAAHLQAFLGRVDQLPG